MTSEFTDQASNFKESHQEGRDEVHEVLHHMSQLFRSISGDAEQSKKLRELGVTDAMASFVQESLDNIPGLYSGLAKNNNTLVQSFLDLYLIAFISKSGVEVQEAYRTSDNGPRACYAVVLKNEDSDDDQYAMSRFEELVHDISIGEHIDVLLQYISADFAHGLRKVHTLFKDGKPFSASQA